MTPPRVIATSCLPPPTVTSSRRNVRDRLVARGQRPSFHCGGSKNSDFPTFGVPLYAVADGTVVEVVDGLPDIAPHGQNLELRTPEDFAGNRVLLKLGPGRYACY